MIGHIAAAATEQRLHPGETMANAGRQRGSISSPAQRYRNNSLTESDASFRSRIAELTDGEDGGNSTPRLLPPIRSDILEKKVFRTEVLWQERLVTLDPAHLRIANVQDHHIIDTIPLHLIASVKFVPDSETVMPSRRNSSQTVSKARRASVARRLSQNSSDMDVQPEPSAKFTFCVVTVAISNQAGRSYFLRTATEQLCTAWIQDLKSAVKAATAQKLKDAELSSLERFRIRAEKVFYGKAVQGTVAAIIIVNFIVNIAAAEITPEIGSRAERGFDVVDYIFTSIFTLELCINLFINWFYPFFYDGWNIFDFAVVLAAWISYAVSSLPGFGTMRLVRVFRVIRLFKKLESMRVIVTSLTASVLPVLNAFVIMLLITSIYAVFAVSLYGKESPLLFGRFSSSFFTMFQVMTGDEWSQVTRELFDNGQLVASVAIFFSTYVLISGIVLINIVVAVLLDEFITAVADEKMLKAMEKQDKDNPSIDHATTALDPLLDTLARLNTAQDVTNRISEIFETLDTTASGSIAYAEMAEGVRRLPLQPPIHLSREDFDVLADSSEIRVDAQGRMDLGNFTHMLQSQLKLYIQRNIQHALQDPETQRSASGSMLLVLKQLNLDVTELRRTGEQREEGLRWELQNLAHKVDEIVLRLRDLQGNSAARATSSPQSIDTAQDSDLHTATTHGADGRRQTWTAGDTRNGEQGSTAWKSGIASAPAGRGRKERRSLPDLFEPDELQPPSISAHKSSGADLAAPAAAQAVEMAGTSAISFPGQRFPPSSPTMLPSRSASSEAEDEIAAARREAGVARSPVVPPRFVSALAEHQDVSPAGWAGNVC